MTQTRAKLRFTWGGARPGAGRKKQEGSGVPHTPREPLASKFPVYVTVRLRDGLPALTSKRAAPILAHHLAAGGDRFGFRLVHYAVGKSRIHMICEAKGREALSRGVQGLKIRVAKGMNRLWGRKGSIFADRYDSRVLRTPGDVKGALDEVRLDGEPRTVVPAKTQLLRAGPRANGSRHGRARSLRHGS